LLALGLNRQCAVCDQRYIYPAERADRCFDQRRVLTNVGQVRDESMHGTGASGAEVGGRLRQFLCVSPDEKEASVTLLVGRKPTTGAGSGDSRRGADN